MRCIWLLPSCTSAVGSFKHIFSKVDIDEHFERQQEQFLSVGICAWVFRRPQKVLHVVVTFQSLSIISSICKLILSSAITYQPGFMCVICVSFAMWGLFYCSLWLELGLPSSELFLSSSLWSVVIELLSVEQRDGGDMTSNNSVYLQ